MINQFVLLSFLILLGFALCFTVCNDTDKFEGRPILSRKKRFLIFPEGSSVQLVFCLSYPAIFNIEEIFLFGNTAALAWELPQDPYSPYRHLADPLHRRIGTQIVYRTNDEGKVLYTKSKYQKKSTPKPTFAKRSINLTSKSEPPVNVEMNHLWMHKVQEKRDFFKSNLTDGRHIHFHRMSRVDLYEKIEILYKALGSDGRQCVLKSLCETGQSLYKPQGSFFQEILRAVFTLPKGKEFEVDYHKDYDVAHSSTGDCEALYSNCRIISLNPTAPIFGY